MLSLTRVVEFLRGRATLRRLLLASFIFRVCLLIYGEWQDARFAVKFTDIDYQVFSDASGHVIRGHSPFSRATYRYTPLLAFLLVPNHLLCFSFGKILFVICDLIVGWLIHEILSLRGVKRLPRLLSVGVWLLNPLTATVSARGNAESLLAVLVLSSLLSLLHGHLSLSGLAFGMAVHVKLFPAIYSLPILLFLEDRQSAVNSSNYHSRSPYTPYGQVGVGALKRFLNARQLKFASVSAATFLSLTGAFYLL